MRVACCAERMDVPESVFNSIEWVTGVAAVQKISQCLSRPIVGQFSTSIGSVGSLIRGGALLMSLAFESRLWRGGVDNLVVC